jgi:hypothetical protein
VTESGTPEGITRREALKRGAAIAGAVWAVPVMQTLNMAAARAQPNGEHEGTSGAQTNPSRPTSTAAGAGSREEDD